MYGRARWDRPPVYSRLSSIDTFSSPTVHSGQTHLSASQMFLQRAARHPNQSHVRRKKESEKNGRTTYLTWRISRPSLTSCGSSLTSFRLVAGSSTVLMPAESAPMSFSFIPPVKWI